MDNVLKTVLRNNRHILAKNIIWTDAFAELLEREVLPKSMIADVQSLEKAEERNSRLLDLLLLRGKGILEKFCDVLQLSGHNFLADLLREEALMITGEEGQKEFSKLDKLLQKPKKEEITKYINEKVRVDVARLTWGRETLDKEKALDAKQQQLEDAWTYKEMIKDRDDTIKGLEGSLNAALLQNEESLSEIKTLNAYIEELKGEHKSNLGVQINFNMANDKSLRRLTEREMANNKAFQEMLNTMDECIQQHIIPGDPPKEEDMTSVNISDRAINKLSRVMAVITYLEHFKAKTEALLEERSMALKVLGVEAPEKESLATTIRGVLNQHEEALSKLRQEVATLTEDLQAKSLPADDAGALELQNMLKKIRAEKQQADEQVKTLEEENKKLKERIAELEKRKELPTPASSSNSLVVTNGVHPEPATPSSLPVPVPAPVPAPTSNHSPKVTAQGTGGAAFSHQGSSMHFGLPPLQRPMRPVMQMKMSMDGPAHSSRGAPTPRNAQEPKPTQSTKWSTSKTPLPTKLTNGIKPVQIMPKQHKPMKITYLKN